MSTPKKIPALDAKSMRSIADLLFFLGGYYHASQTMNGGKIESPSPAGEWEGLMHPREVGTYIDQLRAAADGLSPLPDCAPEQASPQGEENKTATLEAFPMQAAAVQKVNVVDGPRDWSPHIPTLRYKNGFQGDDSFYFQPTEISRKGFKGPGSLYYAWSEVGLFQQWTGSDYGQWVDCISSEEHYSQTLVKRAKEQGYLILNGPMSVPRKVIVHICAMDCAKSEHKGLSGIIITGDEEKPMDSRGFWMAYGDGKKVKFIRWTDLRPQEHTWHADKIRHGWMARFHKDEPWIPLANRVCII